MIGLSDPFTVAGLDPKGLAAKLGIRPGERILAINDVDLHDEIDFAAQSSEELLRVRVLAKDGGVREVEGQREYGIPFGAEFEARQPKRCHNNCVFCFVYQHPKGVRRELLIKDDDYVFSFVHGNFITLTNLSETEFQRIIDERLSPLYVSVHATDPVMRRRLLRNPDAPAILDQLADFRDGGIQFHTQMVIQPGVNDGAVLDRSLQDLWDFGPTVLDVSVVPVGLTEFSGHHKVREPTREECIGMAALVDKWGARGRAERGETWCFGADELYLRAGLPLPDESIFNGHFDQAENGVGAVRWLQHEIREGIDGLDAWRGKRIGVCTGTSMGPLMPQVLAPLTQATGAVFELMVLENDLFGTRVTTAGLLPGSSFQKALAGRRDLDLILIPGECLNDNGKFMDDLTFDALQAVVPIEIRPSKTFVDALEAPAAA